MDRPDRLRIALVAALAVLVMGGVVASALHARRSQADPKAAIGAGLEDRAWIPPRRPRDEPLSPECETHDGKAPQLVFDLANGRLDFGPLAQGVVSEKDVVVRNLGQGVLCIRDHDTGCGCVRADWIGSARVAPGAHGTLRIRIDTAGRDGPQEKHVRLYVNDPARPVAEFTVLADVRLGLRLGGLYGSTLSFGVHALGRPATFTIPVRTPKEDPPWEVLAVESLLPEGERTAFRWELRPTEGEDPADRYAELLLTHPGLHVEGPAYERIRIRTSHPQRPEILLDTQIHVRAKYYTGPVRASFGPIRRDSAAVRTVFVMSAEADAPPPVKAARIEGKGFAAGEPREVREGWAIDLRYDGLARGPGRLNAELVVTLDDPDLPELRVPVDADLAGP